LCPYIITHHKYFGLTGGKRKKMKKNYPNGIIIDIVSLDVLILFIVYKNNNIKIFVINKFLLTIINILFIKNMILKILAV
jgi:hypothetical protein